MLFGFKSVVVVVAVIAATGGGLLSYMNDGDDGNGVQASVPASTGDTTEFVIPDEIREQLPAGFEIPPEIRQALQQRLDQGLPLIPPEIQQAFSGPDGTFDLNAARERFESGQFPGFPPGGTGN